MGERVEDILRESNQSAPCMREHVALNCWRKFVSKPWISNAIYSAASRASLGGRSTCLILASVLEWRRCEDLLSKVQCLTHGDLHGGNVLLTACSLGQSEHSKDACVDTRLID